MQAQEEWRVILGFPNYRVSNMGRVQSNRRGNFGGTRDWHLVTSGKTTAGYPTVYISNDVKAGTAYVHVLVLETFVGPREKSMVACHGNGIRDDNRLVNLRWDTRKGNEQDRLRHGTWSKGNPKLTDKQVNEIKALLSQQQLKQSEIARLYNISQQTICNIKKGRVHKAMWQTLQATAQPAANGVHA